MLETQSFENAATRIGGAAQSKVTQITDDISRAGSHLKKAAFSAVDVAKEQLQTAAERVSKSEQSFERWLQDSCIKDKPLVALLVAIGVGVGLGMWMRKS